MYTVPFALLVQEIQRILLTLSGYGLWAEIFALSALVLLSQS